MKINTFRSTALMLSAFLTHGTASALDGCLTTPEDKMTVVYFANGVLVEDSTDLEMTIRELSAAYKARLEALDPESTYVFMKAYNDTQGLTDIIQVLEQKMQEQGVTDPGFSAYQLLELLTGALTNDEIRAAISGLVGIRDPSGLTAALTDAALEALGDALTQSMIDALADRRTVTSRHVNFYESDLIAGKRVFIVAHSQGNLFTNDALRAVAQRQPDRAQSIASVGVASPAAVTVGANAYITADDDRVINGLRLLSDVLPSNVDNDPGVFGDFRSFTNHYFDQDYFDPRLPSRPGIDGQLEQLATSIPYPKRDAGTGAIRATLTWGQEPDVDLHVFEPNGAQVFYRAKTGVSGFLDVDDVTSFGPENYFVACENVELGRYQIGVNYFKGSAPEVATVSLFLGSGQTVSPQTIVLPSALGTAGNPSPTILFSVDVSADEEGVVSYTVQSAGP